MQEELKTDLSVLLEAFHCLPWCSDLSFIIFPPRRKHREEEKEFSIEIFNKEEILPWLSLPYT